MERDTLSVSANIYSMLDILVVEVASNIGDGHPQEHPEEWETYEGIDKEIAISTFGRTP